MRHRLLPSLAYGAVAIGTGVQQYWHLMWAIWGAPVHSIQYVGLGGSVVVLIAGTVALVSPYRGHLIAGVGILLLWAFYGPALKTTLLEIAANPPALSREPLVLMPPVLLIAATTYMFRQVWKGHHHDGLRNEIRSEGAG